MLERVVTFFVIGLFVFSPSVADWWQMPIREWYEQYSYWLLLIALCYWIQRSEREDRPKL